MNNTNVSAALLCLALAACAATAPSVSPTAKSELAPQGRVRVGILSANPLHVTQGGAPGAEMRGLAPDIGRALARQLGAEFRPVGYPTAAGLLDGAARNEWDVAFIGYSPERASDMDFTPVVVNGENSYLVRGDSPLRSVADVDREGVRVGTSARTVQEVFLKQNLRRATVVSMPNNAALVQALVAGRVDAVAGNRQTMAESNANTPGTRVLAGSFLQVPYAIAIRKGRPAGAAYASGFVQYLKESGALDEAVKRANLTGVTVPQDYSQAGGVNVPTGSAARRY